MTRITSRYQFKQSYESVSAACNSACSATNNAHGTQNTLLRYVYFETDNKGADYSLRNTTPMNSSP